MTHEEILRYCLGKKGAYQDQPFGYEYVVGKLTKKLQKELDNE